MSGRNRLLFQSVRQMPGSRFLFIVGTGRCGTQMLRNILNCNPDVWVLPETHFIPTLYDKFGFDEINYNDFYEVVNDTYGYSSSGMFRWIQTILKEAGKSYDNFYEEFKSHAESTVTNRDVRGYMEAFCEYLCEGKRVYADKTPHYGSELVMLKKIWPEAKVIHMVRDGVDCAMSMMKHPGFVRNISRNVAPNQIGRLKYRDFTITPFDTSVSFESALKFWEALFVATQEQIQKIDSKDVLTVRYEDLVVYPATEIKRIADFLCISENNKWIRKAICLPRPFSERCQMGRFPEKEYRQYYNIIEDSMKAAGYPYKFDIARGFLGNIKEFWRGRYFYLSKINPIILARQLKELFAKN